ncbi:MAG: hypothetical protein E7477_00980 [Ruminococcaceae bacterium]|nr:hypothetical protein [Oscillospiraceae bacterium]
MKKSEEFIRLEEQYRQLKNNGDLKGDVLEFTESMFDMLNKNEMRLSEMEERLLKLEDFSDILSMDLYDIQSVLLKNLDSDDFSDEEDDELGLFDGHCHEDGCDCCDHDCDDDDEDTEASFIRCPFCNTLIFISKEEGEDITCPFCNEAFLRSDVSY